MNSALASRACLCVLSICAPLSIALHRLPNAEDSPRFDERTLARIAQHSPLGPPRADPTNAHAEDRSAAQLGQFLFFDKRLSADEQIDCATCHDPAHSFADGKTISAHGRHVPALWNLAWQRWFFWDGRADSLWSQALQPIETDSELGGDRVAVVHLLQRDRELASAYESVFGALPDVSDVKRFPAHARPLPLHPEHPHQLAWAAMEPEDRDAIDRAFANVGKAIAAYERRLVSRDSPFDRFVRALQSGDRAAARSYGESASRGLALFVGKANCRMCHAGANFTDNEFHDIGVAPLDGSLPSDPGRYAGVARVQLDPFNARGASSDDRQGEAARDLDQLARTAEQWGQFKTPSLRNVARTAPYMHQGQMATLTDVLEYYSTLAGAVSVRHHGEQSIKALHLTPGEIADLTAFLETLTDDALPAELTTAPASPLPPATGTPREAVAPRGQ